MVARYAVNTLKEVETSLSRFDQNGIQVKGVILNSIFRRATGYRIMAITSMNTSQIPNKNKACRMARPVTVGRTSVAPCGKTIWGISMTTETPLISIYMPTRNRQQLAIRAIKSVLRQDYRHWEMIIVDDCSSSYQQLQQFVEELNDPRVRYTHNAGNTGACAVRNRAIMQAQGHYITGIDDDDEWTPNRLSVFLAHKHQLTTHAFLYANDYVCEGEVYSQPASLPLYPKSPIRAAYSTSAILLAIRFLRAAF